MVRASSSERMNYECKSRQQCVFCTDSRLIFVSFDFRGILFCLNQNILFFVNLLVLLDHDIISYANAYLDLSNHIFQIAAFFLLEGEAGLSIIILCTQIRNLWCFDDFNLDPATSNDHPDNTVPALSFKSMASRTLSLRFTFTSIRSMCLCIWSFLLRALNDWNIPRCHIWRWGDECRFKTSIYKSKY